MKIQKIGATLALAGVLAAASGCKDFYDVNKNPLSPTTTTLNTLLPVAQVSMASDLGDNVGGLSQYTMALMQQLYNTRGIGNFQQTGGSFGFPWSDLYSSMLVNNELIITQGTKEQQWGYVGIAQLQKAYVFSQMVDLWGDVPYSQALKGVDNIAPRFDKDVEIYNGSADGSVQSLFALIDEGLANLNKSASNPGLTKSDLIYNGSATKWARFGRTLKLKLYNQIRKTNSNATVISQVTPLLSADLMGEGDDFELAYRNTTNPDNRNPGYVTDFSTNPENRIGRYFYEDMLAKNDPRMPYYFFNQVALTGPPVTQQDYINGPFVTVRPGSTGQYTSSASTASFQTVQGLYPIGGKYDDGKGGKTGTTAAQGKAEAPQRMLTYYARKFTEAELQLTVFNDVAAARATLVEALNASFRKVNTIASNDGSPQLTAAQIAGYINRVAPNNQPITNSGPLDRFDRTHDDPTTAVPNPPYRPTTLEEKLEVIMYEKYVASFGYGVDVYTDFRRTKHPRIRVSQQVADASRGLLPDDGGTQANGVFPHRLYYPTSDLILNPNSPKTQKDVNSTIFWER
ncbi:SusD/RagB family nutrient-binding outer membrane lipoprotein [Hymenobacter sp. BT523]|uniref:SusD/RagB family nutrient-binding outer membrane lipoprotein n=1 Tax=Hymenobacter sp. BT523 TaxID=2795725 RepID=UPI0018EAC5D5|nr:SusD/RagB family nutrient-binding outer membrane lipoprotein [Hymenobacter sp. BT523]MBJ6110096.1 SusD/RagB family nutrient-binding outer membrane lipoprotein [Hymenobacter sp. BT523]